jgi:hypothetical protein
MLNQEIKVGVLRLRHQDLVNKNNLKFRHLDVLPESANHQRTSIEMQNARYSTADALLLRGVLLTFFPTKEDRGVKRCS